MGDCLIACIVLCLFVSYEYRINFKNESINKILELSFAVKSKWLIFIHSKFHNKNYLKKFTKFFY